MGSGRNISSAFQQKAPIGTPGIGDGVQVNRGGALPTPEVSGVGAAPQKAGGLFGSGMDANDFVTLLARAGALAQGDYTGAAQIGGMMSPGKKMQAQQNAELQKEIAMYDYKRAHDAPDQAPIVRDAEAWSRMTPEQKAAYGELERLRQPQLEKGPDGLYYPMGGQASAPTAPVGKLTPFDMGGGAGNGAGGFPRRF